jgi:hypothetical protein
VALATGAGKAHKAKAVLPDAKGKHDSGSHEHHEHAKAKGKSKGKSKSSGSSGNLPWKPILLVTCSHKGSPYRTPHLAAVSL